MPPTQQQQQQQHKKQQQPLRMEFSPPSPILAKSPTPADGTMNGVGFHEISLRSPADQPVVLSFDGHGSISNGSLSNGGGGGGAKSPVEANSQVKLIESGTSSATSSSKKVPPSKCPPLLRPIWLLFSSRRFLLALVLALTIIAIGLIVSLVLVILKWAAAQRHQFEEDADFLNRDSSWRDGCERKCNAKFDVPPLLLISMDGFRADYLQRNSTPSVSRIMQCGSSAKYMSPSYPSKTFPNHYTIVTGLYPESHGIVDNHFYDEDMPDEKNFAKSSRNPAWYNGEPIWNTVTKNGKKSAIFFWPGSEVPIQGMLPTYRYQYNASLPFSKRADQVIDWLRLSETDRPAFLAMYFEQPDTAMHREGPDSDAVNSALIYVDAMINYLMQKLDNNGLLGCINLVILSDHGAQKLREDHFIAMDQFVNAKDPQVGGVFGGTIGHINFRNSASQSFIDRVLAPMSCSAGQTFRVYTRESMPKRYHYTKSGRIGEIVIDSVGGTRLFVDQRSLREHGGMEKGDHGYDNRMREMRAIFGAWGPSIKRGFDVKPFQNIELYNLFTALMQLPVSAPNNGTLGRLHSLLRSPPPIESTAVSELPECEGARLVKCGDGCHFELNYQSGSISVPSSPADASASSASSSSESAASSSVLQSPPTATTKVPVYNAQQCQYADRVVVPSELADGGPSGRLCIIRLCNATMVFNRRLRIASWVESQLAAPIPNIDHRANCTGHLVVPQLRPKTVATTTTTEASTITMMSSSATGQQISKRSKFTSSEGQQSQQPDALAADDENSHEEENHMTSDPTVGGGTMDADASEAAPWNRPGEMTGSEMPTTTATQGPMAVGTTTGMPTSSSPPPFSSSSSAPNSQPQQQQKSPEQLECARLSRQTPAVGMAAAASNVENGPNTSWISLFPDNDYARYIVQGQFRVPSGFYNGPWKQVLSLIRQYVQHYKRLLMWSGPVFDHDHDGLADPITTGDNNGDEENTASSSPPPPPLPPPSHIFLILLRCSNNTWHSDGRHCTQPEATKTLAFALPLVEKDLNCLFPVEYIFRHTASIRDIERLTGNEWFTDRDLYPADLAIKLRTQLNEQLWQLELKT